MGFPKNPWKSQQPQSLIKKFLPYAIYAILSIALFRFYLYPSPPLPLSPAADDDQGSNLTPISITDLYSPSSKEEESGREILQAAPSIPKEKESGNPVLRPASPLREKVSENGVLMKEKGGAIKTPATCDYTNGRWVQDKKGPLYNGTNCGTIKDGQNCMSHGRHDKGYLYWRWKPRECKLPKFNPQSFLTILKGKHLAFVGDSLARNQLESLLCMLASFNPPKLVYSNGDDNKIRKWHFPSHNVTISVYWSPFLVKGVEKSNERNYNTLYFDSVDERWASDLRSIDMVVLSIGHWYLLPAVYFDGGLELGCHSIEGRNCTEVGFYDVFGKAFNTTFKAIIQRKGSKGNDIIDVFVTTFPPHHFEGEWDKLGACPKTKPYIEGEKSLEGMDAQMRKIAVEEVEKAKAMLNFDNTLARVRVSVLDVTKLSFLRPDGHPGPYMYPFPFANGIKERVHNDCVHWCLPGPIDTWNEIMLDIMKRWQISSTR